MRVAARLEWKSFFFAKAKGWQKKIGNGRRKCCPKNIVFKNPIRAGRLFF